jgi:diguanylate cyclase (GGDEF)-like protein
LELLAERSVQMLELSQQQRTLQAHNQHLKTASLTDSLTGLCNRAAFDQHVTSFFVQAQQQQTPLSVMLIDADHFKAYNDQFGHVAGDEALRQLGKILQQTSRKTDIAARYGGEEFVLVLPETDAASAAQIAERLCVQVDQTHFEHRAMTVSIGVATWPQVGAEASITALIEAADQALYRAKRQGRNQVAIAPMLQNI